MKYLRDTKGVHNFIYAISPQMDSAKTVDDFYFRWPGDEWVDFVGMDCYQGINNAVFVTNLKAISKVSLAKLKPCGVTETGVEGFTATDYWTTNIHAPLTGRRVSMVVTWRNKYDPMESGTHYFSVFPGHPSERDFVKMYNQENSFFCSDLPGAVICEISICLQGVAFPEATPCSVRQRGAAGFSNRDPANVFPEGAEQAGERTDGSGQRVGGPVRRNIPENSLPKSFDKKPAGFVSNPGIFS